MISLRNATASDSHAIQELIDQLDYAVTVGEVEARLRLIEDAGQSVLIAEIDGQVVGCLSTSAMNVLHRPAAVGRISMMVVDEQHRGQGIGAEKGCSPGRWRSARCSTP